ncbi:ATP-binding protein [Funiculus sociatus GB2-A5]|uniref:ATP-binding protein n=1 Tax=Funiculus sociatus GB2-A5 TaxID=2933946 RepID=A0ABV0JKH0_9CYAN|nr:MULTISPECIES: AAA family ATPase [Cyanophyceae]MBD1922491.1 AAA family ATPase [Microcoleus sp. FACHB-831]MBD2065732.1 AAA family ATPase [Trichocoleus sp. FACHB-6]
MGSGYFGNQEDNSTPKNPQAKGLLGAGWRPLNRQLDWGFLWHLLFNDSKELTQKGLDLASDIADAMGRNEYTWWANILNVFSENTRYEVDEFWNYITPEPPTPDYRYKDVLWVDAPVIQFVSRNSIPIDYVLNRLQEITIFKILDLVERPDMITQYYLDRHFYYPVDRFVNWERLDIINTVYAFWSKQQVWLEIENLDRGRRRYTLMAKELAPLINKATYNLAVMLSGYQSRVGQIHSQFPIRSFPEDIQGFTDTVQQAILDQNQLAVLVNGDPGTGKTAWTQAVAKEILAPLGYVIFILDHDAVENFVPPSYLERICIIINEADNLAKNRALDAAQNNNKTEHILSLLDGTLYQSVIDESGIQAKQKLVILMTCNTTERLDPAVLRKGRVDLTHEFIHRFV